MSRASTAGTTTAPHEQARRARSAARAGLLGNYLDQVDIFLPVIALAPAALRSDRAVVPG